MNKGDVILLFIFTATAVFFGSNYFLLLNGFEQWSSNFTTLFGVIFGGEVLVFAVYKSFKARLKTKYDSVEFEDEGKHAKKEESDE